MNFSLQTFYKMGIVCFVVVALGNIYSTVALWSVLDMGARVSKIASVCFNFLLVYFFYWMLSSNKQQEEGVGEMMEDEDMIKLLATTKK